VLPTIEIYHVAKKMYHNIISAMRVVHQIKGYAIIISDKHIEKGIVGTN